MSQLKIVIIGAGPAGLTLARLLQIHDIPCCVYESEPDRHSRNQGGTLDLHSRAGQRALKEAGLFEKFTQFSRPEGDCMKVLDKTGRVCYDEAQTGNIRAQNEPSAKPEIDRTDLRDLLLDSLEPGTVKWGRKVDRVELEDAAQGTRAVYFRDGSTETGIDLLIGADGAWSKVRQLVTDIRPYYSGITAATMWKLDVDNKNPWLSKYVGPGSAFMFDQDRAVLSQRQSGGAVRVYAGVRKPESWIKECGIAWNDGPAARRALAEQYFGDCGDEIKRAIIESDDYLDVRHLYMLPVGITWQSKAGVTLLGDSAHLMTPFGGVGVNMAMLDALELAKALTSKGVDLGSSRHIASAIQKYEKEMFPRAAKYAKKTADGLEHHFRATGAQEWAERLNARNQKMSNQAIKLLKVVRSMGARVSLIPKISQWRLKTSVEV